MTETWLDGNALGGPLRELFTLEFTAAIGTCGECGSSAPLAEAKVFSRCPGLVARCPQCASVLLRLVRSQARVWLDSRGLTSMEFRAPE